jgi:hypothetical protein
MPIVLPLLGLSVCAYALVTLRQMGRRRAPNAGDYLARVICWALAWWLGEVLSENLRPHPGEAGYYVLAWLSLLVYLGSIICLLTAGFYAFFRLIPRLQKAPSEDSGEQGNGNGAG